MKIEDVINLEYLNNKEEHKVNPIFNVTQERLEEIQNLIVQCFPKAAKEMKDYLQESLKNGKAAVKRYTFLKHLNGIEFQNISEIAYAVDVAAREETRLITKIEDITENPEAYLLSMLKSMVE